MSQKATISHEQLPSIYILGSGGFARELCFLIQSLQKFTFKGFIDIEKKDPIKIGTRQFEVFAEDLLTSLPAETNLAIGIGNPGLISALSNKFGNHFHFPNLIHPSVIANFEDIELGVGNIFTANCVLTTSIKIGSYNIFNLSSTVGHDVVIGNCNVINPGVNLSGGVEIANRNLLGVNCSVLQYTKIESDCVVGANSFVNKDVLSGTTVVGIPAKPLKK